MKTEVVLKSLAGYTDRISPSFNENRSCIEIINCNSSSVKGFFSLMKTEVVLK